MHVSEWARNGYPKVPFTLVRSASTDIDRTMMLPAEEELVLALTFAANSYAKDAGGIAYRFLDVDIEREIVPWKRKDVWVLKTEYGDVACLATDLSNDGMSIGIGEVIMGTVYVEVIYKDENSK